MARCPSLATLFKNMALVANALITLFAAYEAFFEPKRLWVRETAVLNALQDVRRDLEIELAEETFYPSASAPTRIASTGPCKQPGRLAEGQDSQHGLLRGTIGALR